MKSKECPSAPSSFVADGRERLLAELRVPDSGRRALRRFERRIQRSCRPVFPLGHFRILIARNRLLRHLSRIPARKVSRQSLFLADFSARWKAV